MESRTNLQHTDPWNGIKPELLFACLGGVMLFIALLGTYQLGFQPSQWPQALVFALAILAFLLRRSRPSGAHPQPLPTRVQSVLVTLLAVLPAIGFVWLKAGIAFGMGCAFLSWWVLRPRRIVYPFAAAALFASLLLFEDQWAPDAILYSLTAFGSILFFDALAQRREKSRSNDQTT